MTNKIADGILDNEYFKELYVKAQNNSASKFFKLQNKQFKLTNKEFKDILRFSDILSTSNDPTARNYSFQLLTFLYDDYKTSPVYITFLNAITSRLGNFPALQYIEKEYNFDFELPYIEELRMEVKKIKQFVPGSHGYYFTDSQYSLFNLLKKNNSFSFSGPTSMGKSFMIKSFIRYILTDEPDGNIVVVVPTRALINQFSIEIKSELNNILKERKYRILTNSFLSEINIGSDDNYILILTPERLLSYLSQNNKKELKYIFLDEAHKLGEKHTDIRCITTYLSIQRTISEFPDIKTYFAAPNISNPEVILQLFRKNTKNVFYTKETPVSQNLFFVDLIEGYTQYVSDFGQGLVDFKGNIYKDSLNLIQSLGEDTSNIIYCNSITETMNRAVELSEHLEPENNQEIKEAIRKVKILIHKDYYLIECLKKRVAYHFGSLPQIIRLNIETLFRNGIIKYLFCTSTLIEGVNLPAKNVFILKDRKGNSTFSNIDFWNLAGRAGRLTRELFGNIVCIRESEKDWNKFNLIVEKQNMEIHPSVIKNIESKRSVNLIEEIIQNKPIKTPSKIESEILKYITNIINIDTLEIDKDFKSPIIENLIKNNKNNIIEYAKNNLSKNNVPKDILVNNQSIDINIQNNVYNMILSKIKNRKSVILPFKIDYKIILKHITSLYNIYNWKETENSLKHESKLSYLSTLTNQWVHGSSLNKIIIETINHSHEKKKKIRIIEDSKPIFVVFEKSNLNHINILINNLINEIDNTIRYKFEKYFTHYYTILKVVFGEEKAGANWALFLEYGTQDMSVISLQNMGFTRNSALFLVDSLKFCLIFENNKLVGINKKKLIKALDKSNVEYDDIMSMI